MTKTEEQKKIKRRARIRAVIETAASKAVEWHELPTDKFVQGKVYCHERVLAVDLGRGKICLLELSYSPGSVEGVGEFGLSLLGRDLISVLATQGALSRADVDEAWTMIREHELASKAESEVRQLFALATRHGYGLRKLSKGNREGD